MFNRYDQKTKKPIRNRVVIDCQKAIEEGKEEILVEQSHKSEVDINVIIRKHGMDMIQKTALLNAPNMQWDDVTGNDFQEAMFKVTKAQETFDQLPSELRKKFDFNPAKFLDFVQNPDNKEKMVEYGLANAPVPEPVQKVEVINNVENNQGNNKGVSNEAHTGENIKTTEKTK